MAKTKKTTEQSQPAAEAIKPAEDSDANGEFHLPIEPASGRQAGGNSRTIRLMIALALGLGVGTALLVWWLGSNL